MAVARLALNAMDCADPVPLAEFWAALLEGTTFSPNDDVVVVLTDTIALAAVRVPDYTPPTWPAGETPKHIHFDLTVRDLEEAEAEVLRLGGIKADYQPGPDVWRVYRDPAGHPFCLTTTIPF